MKQASLANEAGFVGHRSLLHFFVVNIQKRQIEYEKTLTSGSEELRKAREDFKKAYLEERECVRVKMCEGREIRIKAIEKSPEYYAGKEQYNHYFDLFFSMEEDYVNYTECRP